MSLDRLDDLIDRAWECVLRALDRVWLRGHPFGPAAVHGPGAVTVAVSRAWARAMGPWRRLRHWWTWDPIAERKARWAVEDADDYADHLRDVVAYWAAWEPPAVVDRPVYRVPLGSRPVRVPVPDVQLTAAQHANIAARVAVVLDAICSPRLDESDAWTRALAVVPDPREEPLYDDTCADHYLPLRRAA